MASLRAVPSIYAFFQQYFFRLLSICIFSPPTFSISSLRSKPSGHATAAFNLSTFFSIYQLFLDFQLSPHQLGVKVSKGWPKKCTVSVLKREILQGLEEKITLMIQSAMRKFLVKVKKRKRVGKLWCGNLVCAARISPIHFESSEWSSSQQLRIPKNVPTQTVFRPDDPV